VSMSVDTVELYTAQHDGLEKGKIRKNERSIEIARNMKKEGFDQSMIVKMTGLSPDEIAQLN